MDKIRNLFWREFYYVHVQNDLNILDYNKKYKYDYENTIMKKFFNSQSNFFLQDALIIKLKKTGFLENRERLYLSLFYKLMLFDWVKCEFIF